MSVRNFQFKLEDIHYRVMVAGSEEDCVMEVKIKGDDFPDAAHFAYMLMYIGADLCEKMGLSSIDQFFGVLDDIAITKRPKAIPADKKESMN